MTISVRIILPKITYNCLTCGNSERQAEVRKKNKTYLIQDRLPFLAVSNSRQLHVSHFLHLLVHVDLLLQLLHFGTKQAHRVLSVMLAGNSGGTCRVDGCDPVLQLCLAAGLHGDRQKKKVRGQTTNQPLDIQSKKLFTCVVLIH